MKTIQQAKENYVQSISLVGPRYQQGVQQADWASAVKTAQANQNWKDGVSKAAQADRWKQAVDKVSNEEWRAMATSKGANAIQEGMRQGQAKYERNFAVVLTAIKSAVDALPPRTTDVMQNIESRLKPVALAAHRAGKRA